MISKRFIYILMGIAVLGFGSYTLWNTGKHQAGDVRIVYKTTSIDPLTKETPEQVPTEARPNNGHERGAPKNGHEYVKSFLTEEQRAHLQDYFKVVESDEFQKFLETDPTLEERFNFLSDRGIGDLPRNLNMLLFRESFPTGDPAEFEPGMRQKLAQMLREGGVVPLPPESPQIRERTQAMTPEEIDQISGLLDQYGIEETLQRLQASDPGLAEVVQYRIETAPDRMNAQEIIRDFFADERTIHWQMGYFKGELPEKIVLMSGRKKCCPRSLLPSPETLHLWIHLSTFHRQKIRSLIPQRIRMLPMFSYNPLMLPSVSKSGYP